MTPAGARMNKAVPWSIKGVDFDAREAAKEAARRSGLTLGEWLNSIIADQAAELGVEPAEIDADTRLEAVAARLARLTHGNSAATPRPLRDRLPAARRTDEPKAEMASWQVKDSLRAATRDLLSEFDEEAPKPAREANPLDRRPLARETFYRDAMPRHSRASGEAAEPARDLPGRETLLDNAVEQFERRTRDSQKKAANALSTVAQWIEVSESRRDYERDALDKVTQRLDDIQHHVAGGAARGDRQAREALDKVARRLEDIEGHVAGRSDDDRQQPVRQALARLETRLDAMARRPVHAPVVETSLRELDSKIESLNSRLDLSQGDKSRAEQLARLEAKVGKIADWIVAPVQERASRVESASVTELRPRFAREKPSVGDAIADIARRQRDLDTGTGGPSVSSFAIRAAQDAPQTRPARPAAPNDFDRRLEAIATRLEQSGETAAKTRGQDSSALSGLQGDIAALAARLDDMRRDRATPAPQTPDPQLAQLRTDIAALSQTLGTLAPRGSVTALEGAMRELGLRIEASRGAGARENLIAPIEQLANELRAAMQALDPRPTIEVLHREIKSINGKIESMGGRGLDREFLHQVQTQTQEIRNLVNAAAARPLPVENIERQIAALGERIERISALTQQPAQKPDFSGLAGEIRGMVTSALPHAALETIEQRLGVLDGKIDEAIAQGSGGTHLADLSLRMDEVQRALAAPKPANVDLRPFETMIRDLSQRMEAARRSDAPAQSLQELDSKLSGIAAQLQRSDEGMSTLARRMDVVHEKVSERLDIHAAASGQNGALEGLLQDFAGKMQVPRDDGRATEALQALGTQLHRIAERLDRSDKGLNSLSTTAGLHFETLSRRIDTVQVNVAQQLEAVRHATDGMPQADVSVIEEMVRQLASKVDAAGAPNPPAQALGALEAQVARIAEMLERAPAPVHHAPDLSALEHMVHGLAEKMQAVAVANPSAQAIEALQEQVARMSQQIQAADRSVPGLAALERSISDLFAHVEDSRHASVEAAEAAARAAARDALRDAMQAAPGLPSPDVTRELDGLRTLQDAADRRTHSTLSAVHETLEKVVDRLAMLEVNAAGTQTPVAPARPVAKAEAAPVRLTRYSAEDAADAPLGGPRAGEDAPKAARAPEDDFLIEPGSGGRAKAARARDGGEADVRTDADAGGVAQKSFIAAARRAAQAAAADSISTAAAAAAAPRVRMTAAEADDAATGGLVSKAKVYAFSRRKPLLLTLAALLLVFGAVAFVNKIDRGPAPVANTVDAAPVKKSALPAAGSQATTASEPEAAPKPQNGAGLTEPRAAAPGTSWLTPPPGGKIANAVPLDRSPVGTIARAPLAAPLAAGSPSRSLASLANSGNAAAQYETGMRIIDGRTQPRDFKEAAQWFDKAAAQGLAPAQYHLGSMYEKGVGVAKDLTQAKVWYKLAADKGNERAMHNLAVLTAEGKDNTPDYAGAVTWFAKAADRGVRDSQFNLAILYARGLGVSQNLISSYVWFTIAANQGDEDAGKKRLEVAAKLDGKQLAAAKAQVEAFRPLPLDRAANEVAPPPGGWDVVAQKSEAEPAAASTAADKPAAVPFGKINVKAGAATL